MEVKKIGRLEDYEAINIIGTGSFGTCYKVRKKSNGFVYVWKAIGYGGMSEEKKQLLVSEVNLLSELRHPNIVQYYDRIIHRESATLYIVMEWCQGGDLSSLISKCKKSGSFLDEGFVWQVLCQMCRALQACHWQLSKTTILHRDIKPANVFLDESGNIKLGDFGLARILHDDVSYAQTIVGTPYYMSPEVIKGGKYNRKSDIWSLGCLIYELCSLTPPFTGSNIKQLALKIKEGKYTRIPAHYSDDLQKIISLLLSVDHNLRPTIEVILHHPTVVLHIAQETIKISIVKDVISASISDNSDSNKEINEKHVNDFIWLKEDLSDLHISNQNKNLFPIERLDYKNPSNDKARDIWLSRIHVLKQRESSLRLKELAIDERERALAKKEKQVALLDRLSKEKMTRADIYLRQCREVRSVANSFKNTYQQQQMNTIEDDLDTTVSADPGDTSILPTSTKLKPASISKPTSFVRIGSERRVHFDTLPLTKSKTKHFSDLEISAKQNQFICQKKDISNAVRVPEKELYDLPECYVPSNSSVPERGKVLQERNSKMFFQHLCKAEEDNYKNGVLASLNSNQQENKDTIGSFTQLPTKSLSWKEERTMWLANKRQAYHDISCVKTHKTANKENSLGPQKQRIMKFIGTSTATMSSVPESGLGSLLSFR